MAVTAYLAVSANGQVSREELAEMLWGGVAPEQSRHSVRQALLQIRRTLGPVAGRWLTATADTARLDHRHLLVDVHRFERAIARNTPRSIALACTLYRGDFLAGLHVREPAFDHWMLTERNRLKQLAAEALQQRIEWLITTNDTARALQSALRLIALDPFHEWGHRAVITIYARRSQIGAARRHYDTFARHLKEELDLEPEHETRELLRQLLRDRGGDSS
jgi:DNA-binding SARP family transcriptional activator